MDSKQDGFSLVELIISIVVMGVVIVGILSAMSQVLVGTTAPKEILQASFLASARAEIIRLQRAAVGTPSLSDPCQGGSAAICTPLASFATANGLTVNSTITPVGLNKQIQVQVSGKGSATIETLIGNF